MERQPQILDIEQVIKAKAGKKAKRIPKFVIKWFKKFIHIDFINEYLKEGYIGVEFCENAIKYLGVELEIHGLENLPKDGRAYTFVSNHPLGAIDGVTLGAVIGREYDGKIKYLMNDLLMNLKGMAPLGIPINKLGGQARNLPKLINNYVCAQVVFYIDCFFWCDKVQASINVRVEIHAVIFNLI